MKNEETWIRQQTKHLHWLQSLGSPRITNHLAYRFKCKFSDEEKLVQRIDCCCCCCWKLKKKWKQIGNNEQFSFLWNAMKKVFAFQQNVTIATSQPARLKHNEKWNKPFWNLIDLRINCLARSLTIFGMNKMNNKRFGQSWFSICFHFFALLQLLLALFSNVIDCSSTQVENKFVDPFSRVNLKKDPAKRVSNSSVLIQFRLFDQMYSVMMIKYLTFKASVLIALKLNGKKGFPNPDGFAVCYFPNSKTLIDCYFHLWFFFESWISLSW